MSETRIAQLLRAYGVGTRMSYREAGRRCELSGETVARLMRGNDPRKIRKANLDKLARGLGIPRDLLEREVMADWGYTTAVSPGTVGDVLAQVRNLSVDDMAQVVSEISRMQRAKMRGELTDVDPKGDDPANPE